MEPNFATDAASRGPQLALAVVLSITAWELARYAFGGLGKLVRASTREFVARRGVQVDVFKFTGRQYVREQILNDVEVQAGILDAARAGEPPDTARARVDEYIEEIIPRFSLTAYFRFGYVAARTILRLAYRVEYDHRSFEKLKSLPPNASVMFLMNHRSNADYLLVAAALARRVAISFAIGEWARVFPLDLLFKLFGGYFLRRSFRDPLYHTVLRRYLQLIVRHGVTQGLFPEGKLSRDGSLGEPKIGLLDGMVSMAAEPGFDREIIFVPVGLNFDRVLEDGFLLTEGDRTRPPTPREKLISSLKLLPSLPVTLAQAALRLVTGRLQRFGYASVSFGEPVKLSEFAATKGYTAAAFAGLSKDLRRPLVKALADHMMARIAGAIPATPVPLAAHVLVAAGGAATRNELVTRTIELAKSLEAAGTPVIQGREVQRIGDARAQIVAQREAEVRRPELARLEEDILSAEVVSSSLDVGLRRLRERNLVTVDGEMVRIVESRRVLVEYYAKSILTSRQGS